MIIEQRPLHKKKKRLAKQRSIREVSLTHEIRDNCSISVASEWGVGKRKNRTLQLWSGVASSALLSISMNYRPQKIRTLVSRLARVPSTCLTLKDSRTKSIYLGQFLLLSIVNSQQCQYTGNVPLLLYCLAHGERFFPCKVFPTLPPVKLLFSLAESTLL